MPKKMQILWLSKGPPDPTFFMNTIKEASKKGVFKDNFKEAIVHNTTSFLQCSNFVEQQLPDVLIFDLEYITDLEVQGLHCAKAVAKKAQEENKDFPNWFYRPKG
jgi:hypothetical protein